MQSVGTGMLGRLSDALFADNYTVNAFSVDSTLIPLEGRQHEGIKVAVNSKVGFQKFNPTAKRIDNIVNENFDWLNGMHGPYSSIFGETWSSSVHKSIDLVNRLHKVQQNVRSKANFPDSDLGRQLALISKLIASKDCRGSNRDVFFVETGNYDHHDKLDISLKQEFDILNDGLEAFIDEMKSLPGNVWDNLAIVVSSDFGRTLTPNSKGGSDHGWSGNTFMIGGSINGGHILGEFPDNLTENSLLNVGRGRLIPTTPFEAPWNAIIQWLGVVNEDEIDKILPNRKSFPKTTLFEKEQVFVEMESISSECKGEGNVVFCT